MPAHSFLPPSGAAAWSRCALWPTMNAKYPDTDSAASAEGTAAHWVVSEMLAGRVPLENNLAPNGALITGEMLDGAEMVCDVVARRMPGLTLHIEETIAAPSIHPDCFGTPDVWARTGASQHIEIVDYKFGHGYVDEYFNLQGLVYLAGILEREFDIHHLDPSLSVSFTIVQPRCYYRGEPVRTHDFTVSELPKYMVALRAAALAATQPNPAATTNPECKHCPGRHACSALQLAAYSDAEVSNDTQPHDLTPQAAALELRMLERALSRLEARVEGLRELTLANLRAGASVPYFRIESGRGRAQWTASPEEVIALGRLMGKDLSKPGLLTPSQAKKIIDESVISGYSQIIPGAPKLVAENNATAARVFKGA